MQCTCVPELFALIIPAAKHAIILTLQYIVHLYGLTSTLDLVQVLRRLDVLLASPEEVVHTSEGQDAAEHHNAPVHVRDSRRVDHG